MPYEKSPVHITCDIISCSHNDDRTCEYDGSVEDIDPDTFDCSEYTTSKDITKGVSYNTLQTVFYEMEDYADIMPVESLDPFSLRLILKKLPCLTHKKRHDHQTLYQMSEETELLFNFRPHVDGGILMIPKNQLDLFSVN